MNTDIVRLATIIDCEGWITIQRQSASSRGVALALVLGVGNTNAKLTNWLKSKFGGSVYYTKRASMHHKDYFTWRIYSSTAAELLKACLPYMLLKEEQAILAITFQATMHSKDSYNELCTPEYVAKMQSIKRRMSQLNRKGKLSPAETERDNTSFTEKVNGEATVRTCAKAQELDRNVLAQALPA